MVSAVTFLEGTGLNIVAIEEMVKRAILEIARIQGFTRERCCGSSVGADRSELCAYFIKLGAALFRTLMIICS